MKIDDLVENIVVKSDEFESRHCSIDAEDMRYITSLLRNNYSDTILATVRETFANALDANAENGKDASSIIVTLPTSFDPKFSIRDFGSGLLRNEMFELYTKYGKSTKRSSNNAIGGFGIGRFAPLSYNKDGFTVTSFTNGTKSIYNIYVSEENDTTIDEIFSESTNEANGIEVSVNVKHCDINRFSKTCFDFFNFFETLPQFKNFNYDPANREKPSLSGNNWKIYSNYQNTGNKIVIGGISYPLQFDQLDFCGFEWMNQVNNIHIYSPIGSVKIHHSRESLEYNNQTKKYLVSFLKNISEEIKENLLHRFDGIDCVREAKLIAFSLKNSLPHNLYNAVIPEIKICGSVTIGGYYFNETSYLDAKGIRHRIPVSIREFHKSDDYSVSHGRCNSMPAAKNVAYVFNDMPSGTKIICRIFPLFENHEKVIVVSQDLEQTNQIDGVKLFKDQNNFDFVKFGKFNLSDLPSVKIPRPTNPKRTSYSPNYFFLFEGYYQTICRADKNIINDTNIIKPYVEIKNREPIGDYAGRIDILCDLSDKLLDAFETKIYGVSVSMSKTKKFKDASDFISLKDYLQKVWNDFSNSEKELFVRYVSYDLQSFSDQDVFDFLIAASPIGFTNDDFDSFLKNKNEIFEKVNNLNLMKKFDVFKRVLCLNFIFKIIDFGEFSPKLNFDTRVVYEKLKKLYPAYVYFLKCFDACASWKEADRIAVLKSFVEYAKMADFYAKENNQKTS